MRSTDIIFDTLPPSLDRVGRFLSRLGFRVFYLSLAGDAGALELRAGGLREAGVTPLPLEQCDRLVGVLKYLADPDGWLRNKVERCAPGALLAGVARLFPDNTDVVPKLHVVIQTRLAQHLGNANSLRLWAATQLDRRHVVIDPSAFGWLAPKVAANVTRFVIPCDLAARTGRLIVGIVLAPWRALMARVMTVPSRPAAAGHAVGEHQSSSRAAVVTHQGLSYGSLFAKTLWYSDDRNSERHRSRLLHFDYSGVPSPEPGLLWVRLGERPAHVVRATGHAILAVWYGVARVRSLRHLIGLALLVQVYVSFRHYREALAAFPSLKLAMIDYDILCPKALLLAFESCGVTTVAAQERFLMPFYQTVGCIVDTYLCGSGYLVPLMTASPAYRVRRYLPMGQYRTDKLVEARGSLPPAIVGRAIADGRWIVTALGFHTQMEWHRSESDPVLSWSAQRLFLEDMLRLSREVPDIFVVLRFKEVDWLSLPAFADLRRELEASPTVAISMDYDKPFVSYELCAHSDLVIAKHTSLGDECLAAGIPVLYHEYTHNTERLVADAFGYDSARIQCFDYEQLRSRTRAILGGPGVPLKADFDRLRRCVFGDLGDGHVRERLHAYVDGLLA